MAVVDHGLPELAHKGPIDSAKHLHRVVVCVGHDDVARRGIHGDVARLIQLAVASPRFSNWRRKDPNLLTHTYTHRLSLSLSISISLSHKKGERKRDVEREKK